MLSSDAGGVEPEILQEDTATMALLQAELSSFNCVCELAYSITPLAACTKRLWSFKLFLDVISWDLFLLINAGLFMT